MGKNYETQEPPWHQMRARLPWRAIRTALVLEHDQCIRDEKHYNKEACGIHSRTIFAEKEGPREYTPSCFLHDILTTCYEAFPYHTLFTPNKTWYPNRLTFKWEAQRKIQFLHDLWPESANRTKISAPSCITRAKIDKRSSEGSRPNKIVLNRPDCTITKSKLCLFTWRTLQGFTNNAKNT